MLGMVIWCVPLLSNCLHILHLLLLLLLYVCEYWKLRLWVLKGNYLPHLVSRLRMSGAVPPLSICLCGMQRNEIYLYCTYDIKYVKFVWYDSELSYRHHFVAVDLKQFFRALYLEICRVYLIAYFSVPNTLRTTVKGYVCTATMLCYILQKDALTEVAFSLQGCHRAWFQDCELGGASIWPTSHVRASDMYWLLSVEH
jgi:hypothetical protein